MRRVTPEGLLVVAVVLAAGAGAAIAASPLVGVGVAAAVPGLALVVSSAKARLVTVTLGALLVFQSEAAGAKYVYLAAATLCFALAAARLARTDDELLSAFRPLLPAGLVVWLLVGASALVARSTGTSLANWAADVLPYVLLVVLPVVGIDAAADVTPRVAGAIICFVGVLAAVGFAVDWLSRRGVSSLGVDRVVLATTAVPALAFAYALVNASLAPRMLRWPVLAVTIAALMLVTGTRTNLVLVFVCAGLVGAAAKARFTVGRLLLVAGATVAGCAATLPLLGGLVLSDPGFLTGRLAAAVTASRNGLADQSFAIRAASYASARAQFAEHPWFGSGPGHMYPGGTFTLDTPWMVPAKFGLVGTLVLLGFLSAVVASVRRLRRLVGYRHAMTAARGWAFVMAGLTPFGPWLEDKGTALALMLALAFVTADARSATGGRVGSADRNHGPSGVVLRPGDRRVGPGLVRRGLAVRAA